MTVMRLNVELSYNIEPGVQYLVIMNTEMQV